MHAAVTDWHFTPPALGIGLNRARPASSAPVDQFFRECVTPAVSAATPSAFLDEIRRRLPLFSVLRTQLLERLFAEIPGDELPPLLRQAYTTVGSELHRWAQVLDETTRMELEAALAKLDRVNRAVLSALENASPCVAHVPDLFRTAVIVDFLVFCLLDMAARNARDSVALQLVNSFRYAALDYAEAARKSLSSRD